MSAYYRLDGANCTLLIAAPQGEEPRLLHFGAPLPDGADAEAIAAMRFRGHVWGGPDAAVPLTANASLGGGHPGAPGLEMHRDGRDWQARAVVERVEQGAGMLAIQCADATAQIAIIHHYALDGDSGVLSVSSHVHNRGDAALTLDWLAAVSLPVPRTLDHATGFTGRWAREFMTERFALPPGQWQRENRRGRGGHDGWPGLVLHDGPFDEARGEAMGLALAWSGNYRLRVERLATGAAMVQAGALFLPGEMRLEPGQGYDTPVAHVAISDAGLNPISQRFHRHLLAHIVPESVTAKPRPVHYNSWEAVYFAHDLAKLSALAEQAADLGCERFVLDDGWFLGRDHDRAGLGDWTVDTGKYPDGLDPLIDAVTGLGMEFGLWVEPEMVNPDSDLFRAHPDWVLRAPGIDQIASRHQLVLDLTQTEVCDYLFTALDKLLSDHAISYLKWDMNRDVHHPGGADGRAVMTAQVDAVHALIDRLRMAHPGVEIESCASGGGRADFAMLARCERIWTSDCNDAGERQHIQHGASLFLPLAVTGAHVGPSPGHQTGRRLPMHFRAATALFGHMGVEADITALDDDDRRVLKAAIALHKRHRALIHGGDLVRIAHDAVHRSFGVVSKTRDEGLFSFALLQPHATGEPGLWRLAGLDAERSYTVRLVWPERPVWLTEPNALTTLGLDQDGANLSGAALMQVGLQLPLLFPDSCLILYAKACD